MSNYDLENDRDFGHFSVGRGTYWGPSAEFRTYTAVEKVEIGRYCSIAARAVICSGGQHHLETVSTWPFENFLDGRENPTRTYRPISNTVVGSDVWIGFGAFIGGSARIGDGAVIGASAVVMKDVPPYAIIAGNPGRILRFRFEPAIVEALLKIQWWNWPVDVISARREDFYKPIEQFIGLYEPPS